MTRDGEAPKLVALVPMRHHSERVQGKNYKPLAGKPLFAYILEALRACQEVERIVVDTDSPPIRGAVEADFPEVTLLERPEHLRGGDIPMNDVLRHDVSQVPAHFYVQTHSTNPLLRPETISDAITQFFAAYPEKDTLFSVTPLQARLWDAEGRAINHDPDVLLNTQDLPAVYVENSCLYIFKRGVFLERGNRIGERPLLYEIGAQEALDIDQESDFALAERLMESAPA
ncbi:MAG: cytidylyltransferase domain-containing protein [Anaerolineales bacterium]